MSMVRMNKTADVLPEKQHECLLQAALLSGDDVVKAWTDWKSIVSDIDRLDGRSYQLFPLVYRNLERFGVKDEATDRLKSVYVYHWAKNRVALQQLRAIIDGLNSLGVKNLVLKGGALIPLYYGAVGTRVMGDLDILVSVQDFQKAADFLRGVNWIPRKRPQRFDPRFFYSITFNASEGAAVGKFEIDLHCHVLFEACDSDADALFWEGSLPFVFQGVNTRVLCPTDQLLHACVHGIKKEWSDSNYKWIPDAMMILRYEGERVDWDRLVMLSEKFGVAPLLAISLSYLAESMGANIPSEVIDRLDNAQISGIQRLRCKMSLIDFRAHPIALMKWHWCIYSQGVKSAGLCARLVGLPKYLKYLVQTNNGLLFSVKFPYKFAKLLCRTVVNRFSKS